MQYVHVLEQHACGACRCVCACLHLCDTQRDRELQVGVKKKRMVCVCVYVTIAVWQHLCEQLSLSLTSAVMPCWPSQGLLGNCANSSGQQSLGCTQITSAVPLHCLSTGPWRTGTQPEENSTKTLHNVPFKMSWKVRCFHQLLHKLHSLTSNFLYKCPDDGVVHSSTKYMCFLNECLGLSFLCEDLCINSPVPTGCPPVIPNPDSDHQLLLCLHTLQNLAPYNENRVFNRFIKPNKQYMSLMCICMLELQQTNGSFLK